MYRKRFLSLKQNYFEFSLYLLGMSIFFGNAAVSIATVIFFFNLLFFNKVELLGFLEKKVLVTISLYFFIITMILFAMIDDYADLVEIKDYLPFLFYPLIIFSFKKVITKSKTKRNLCVIYISSALISFICSFIYGLWRTFFFEKSINPIYLSYKFLSEPFGVHQIYLSVFYVLAIIFCVDRYVIEKQKFMQKIYIFIAIILFIGIVLLSSRTTILASFIVVLIKFWSLKFLRNNKIIYGLIFLLLLGAIITISTPTLRKRVLNVNQNLSSYSGVSFRMKIWDNAVEVYKHSPIYGYGFTKSQLQLNKQYHKVNFRRAILGNFNAHNQYIQTLLDSGIIGLISLLLMLFSPFLFIRQNTNIKLFSILIIISLISESFLVRQNGIVFYCLFMSIFTLNNFEECGSKKD